MPHPLGTAQGVPVTLVGVDEARATPICLDRDVPTRPYAPPPGRFRVRPARHGHDPYKEAVLRAAVACLQAYQVAHPDWWAMQAAALCRVPCTAQTGRELVACVEAAEREPGASHWAHALHTNESQAPTCVVEANRTYVLPACSAFLLTHLLPSPPRVPHGWASVCALGTCAALTQRMLMVAPPS